MYNTVTLWFSYTSVPKCTSYICTCSSVLQSGSFQLFSVYFCLSIIIIHSSNYLTGCDESCLLTCTKSGPSGCDLCKEGYTMKDDACEGQ